jgi:1-acyl-sn-glycerol-3-phosphate acyltransferase
MSAVASPARSRRRAGVPGGESRLYDLVAHGLAAYARARYRVRVLGAPFELQERLLIASSHRSDDDIPLLVGALYGAAHGRLRRGVPVHFVVRDDLFEPGFFAGYPPSLPRAARRLLFPLNVGPVLRRFLPCHPTRRPGGIRLVQLLRAEPELPLEELLPPLLLGPLRERAAGLGRSARLAGDVLSGDYADLLWRVTEREEADEPAAEAFWRARRAGALRDFRELVEVLHAGRPLLICPEGFPSPDGSFGPVMDGVVGLARRGEVERLVPLAPAYDPLAAGRPHALVGVGAPVEPPADAGAVLDLLRRTTPLTVGSSLAAALADGDDPEERLAADVEAARESGRPFELELADPAVRHRRLAAARRATAGRDLDRLATEYRDARR